MMGQALGFLNNHVENILATVDGNRSYLRASPIMKQEPPPISSPPNTKRSTAICPPPHTESLVMHDSRAIRCSRIADFGVDASARHWTYAHNKVLHCLYPSNEMMAYFKPSVECLEHYDQRPTPTTHKSPDFATSECRSGFVGTQFSK